jgi:Ca2+-binding EF-hand superfamily protein
MMIIELSKQGTQGRRGYVRSVVTSRAGVTALACVVAFRVAVATGGAWAAPRQDADEQGIAAAGALPPAAIAVALPPRRVAVADRDRDGIVTPAEAARYYDARFALIDRDRDGRLSRPELERSAAPPPSRSSGGSWAMPLDFETIDRDDNGAIAPKEFRRADGSPGVWSVDAGAYGRQGIFEVVDRDRDGALGKEEFTDAGAADFAASDADGDGRVTIREFYGGKHL